MTRPFEMHYTKVLHCLLQILNLQCGIIVSKSQTKTNFPIITIDVQLSVIRETLVYLMILWLLRIWHVIEISKKETVSFDEQKTKPKYHYGILEIVEFELRSYNDSMNRKKQLSIYTVYCHKRCYSLTLCQSHFVNCRIIKRQLTAM